MISWVKNLFPLTPTEDNEDARTAWTLRIFLITFAVVTVLHQIFAWIMRPDEERWQHAVIGGAFLLISGVIFLILQTGNVKLATKLFIIATHLMMSVLVVYLGGLQTNFYYLFVLLIFIAGFLAGRWASFISMIYAMLLGHGVWMLGEWGLLPQPIMVFSDNSTPLFIPFLAFFIAFGLVNVIVYLLKWTVGQAQEQRQEALGHSQALQQEAIERRAMAAKLGLYNKRLETLRDIDQAILSAESAKAIAQAVLGRIRTLIPYQRASVMVADKGGHGAMLLAAHTLAESTMKVGHPLPYSFTAVQSGFALGEVRVVQDLASRPKHSRAEENLFSEGILSYVIAPLIAESRLIGTLNLGFDRVDGFTDEYIEVVREVAYTLSIAIHQSRLREQLQEQKDELADRVAQRTAELRRQLQWNSALAALEPIISQPGELDHILYQIVSAVIDVFPAGTAASIVLKNPNDEAFIMQVARLETFRPTPKTAEWRTGGQTQQIMDKQEVVVIPDIDQSPLSLSEWASALGIGSYVAVPLISQGNSLGVLYMSHMEPRNYRQEEVDFLRALGNRAAVAVTNVRLNEALQDTNEELSQIARLKDNFLATMSHELRTPLTAILGLTESLQMGVYGTTNERQTQSLKDIAASGEHLLDLINDILDVSKIEAGQLALTHDWIDVQSLCQSSLRLVEQNAQQKNLKVTFSIDSSLDSMWGDERRLRQILVNLLSNAVKFTPAGGQIGLEAYGNDFTQEAIFTVWDTGVGIDRTSLKRLFTPFVQLDSSLSREYEGTGLGLALVKRLTELHGGQVSVDTHIGEGSRFVVTLPWEREGDELPTLITEITESAKEPILTQKATVLVAEDNTISRETITDFLNFKGFKSLSADNGYDAIILAEENRPDLILMDIQMPRMDGLEAIRLLRGKAYDKPIVALTGLAMAGDEDRCLEAGATAYLSKPISLEKLTQIIVEYLN